MTTKSEMDASRSKIMARVKSQGNKSTELKFIKALKARSIFGWRRHLSVYGKPDFVFLKKRIAVFIDGCFWHGCSKHCRLPATNVSYWLNKIENNTHRDKQVTKKLKKNNWIVFRFWEHELPKDKLLIGKLNRLQHLLQNSRKSAKRKRVRR